MPTLEARVELNMVGPVCCLTNTGEQLAEAGDRQGSQFQGLGFGMGPVCPQFSCSPTSLPILQSTLQKQTAALTWLLRAFGVSSYGGLALHLILDFELRCEMSFQSCARFVPREPNTP